MVITCLLITGIVIASRFHFFDPSTEQVTIPESSICEGYVEEVNLNKLFVSLFGCKEGDLLKPVYGRVQLTVNAQSLPYRYGDIIRFKSTLHLPTNFNNPGGFDFKRFCQMKNITALAFINDPLWITKIGEISGHKIRRFIEEQRIKISSSLDIISDKDLRGVAKALTIGDGSGISEDTKEDFRKSGLMHLLVISGLNVGFVALFLFFFLKRIFVLIPKFADRFDIFKPIALCTIIGVWFYAYITGAEVSVLRAAIMATVYLLGIAFSKRQDIFTSLAISALIIISLSPLAVYDISFQLSFMTLLSIALLYPFFVKKIGCLNPTQNETFLLRIRRYVIEGAFVSLSAMIGAAPLIAYYFHYSSFVGIIANVIVVPWAGFILTPFAMIVSVFAIISQALAAPFVHAFTYLIIPMAKVASLAASISNPFTIAFTPPLVSVVMFYHIVAFIIIPKLRWKWSRPLGITLFSLILIFAIGKQHEWFSQKQLSVTFLDVGQGSSVVVKFPTGKVMVVDGGGIKNGSFDIGKFVIAPYLWQRGISKVDLLLLTHAHPDHFMGLGFLAEEFSPKVLLWNGILPDQDEDMESWKIFYRRVISSEVPIEIVSEGYNFEEGETNVNILSPPMPVPSNWNLNDTSIVTRIDYGKDSYLLTGDIEETAENHLIKNKLITSHNSLVTVLQVPHHGSLTSSSIEFLKMVSPKTAVIQLGIGNRYGFPNNEVLDRLKEMGANVYRTDINGAVTLTSHF